MNTVAAKSLVPDLSIVIVTLNGLDGLTVALPGLRAQTIADRIELVVVAGEGQVDRSELEAMAEFHSTQLVELPEIRNRSVDAFAGAQRAKAPLIGLHENHTRAEPQTYERLIAAARPSDGALAPVIYPANGEMPWGMAMYSLAHAGAMPPNDAAPQQALVLHNAIYRADMLLELGTENEPGLQSEIVQRGLELRYVPGTVVWHINEARPARVLADAFTLGRSFGFSRRPVMGLTERLFRAVLIPANMGLNGLRILRNAYAASIGRGPFLRSAMPAFMAGLAFGLGEVLGYFDAKNNWGEHNEMHEFHVRGRLASKEPAAIWLRQAISSLPDTAP